MTVKSDCATVTVNSDRYLTVLKRFWRDLNANCMDTISLQWLQQDGAPPRTSRSTMALLSERMGDRIISQPHSPDISPLDFYIWGFIKSVVYAKNPQTLKQPRNSIRTCIRKIPLETCGREAQEALRRSAICAERKGGHLER